MLQIIFETLWFFLPAIIANMAPVFAARYNWLAGLNIPLDFGYQWNNGALLGSNKTVRGLLVGVIAAAIVGWLQGDLLLGAGLGLGALLGDAIKSFLKRRLNIPSGESWKPWDQIDFVLGAIVVSVIFYSLSVTHYLIALVIIGFGSYLVSYVGIKLNIKKSI